MSEDYKVTDRLDEEAVLGESDAFAELLNDTAEQTAPEPEATEPAEEVEDEQLPAEESESSVEGPTAEMLAVAKVAGVPEELLSGAKDNDAVARLVDWFSAQNEVQPQDPEPEPPQEPQPDLSLQDMLGDDFDADDPVHKQLKHVIDVVNKQRSQDRRAIQLLLQHANSQIRDQQQSQAMEFQRPYDAALDELGMAELGDSSKGLTQAQIKLRGAAFNAYKQLVEGEPTERRKDIAHAAVRAKFSHLFAERERKQEKRTKQSMNRLGGRPAAATPEAVNDLDAFAEALAAISQS